MINSYNNEELLKIALQSGIISLSDMAEKLDAMERKEILEKHPYEIWESKDGRFRTYVVDKTMKGGRRLIVRTKLENLENAIVEDYKLNHEQRHQIYQLFDDWMDYARETNDLSLNSIDRYTNDFKKYIMETNFAKRDIKSITEDDIICFMESLVIGKNEEEKLTRKCFTNIKIVVNGIFTYAKSRKKIKCISVRDTLQNIKFSDRHFKYSIKKDSEEVYSDEEINKLVNHIIDSHINMRYKGTRELGILFIALTGIRIGELVTLKTSDEENGKLYIQRTLTKGKIDGKTTWYEKDYPKTVESMNGIELNDSAIEVWNWIRKINMKNGIFSEYMFYEEKFGRLKLCHFERTLRRLCKEVDIPYKSLHKLRKTYSSILFANDVDKKTIQSQMRHRSFKTTEAHYLFSTRSREYVREQINQADIIKIKNREKDLIMSNFG